MSCIAAMPVGDLMELGVADPVLALNAPADPHQSQQRFWRVAQVLPIPPAGGPNLHDPARADTVLADELRCFFGANITCVAIPVAHLVIACR